MTEEINLITTISLLFLNKNVVLIVFYSLYLDLTDLFLDDTAIYSLYYLYNNKSK